MLLVEVEVVAVVAGDRRGLLITTENVVTGRL